MKNQFEYQSKHPKDNRQEHNHPLVQATTPYVPNNQSDSFIMTVLRIRPYSIACRSCGIEMYFVANTTGRSSTISIRCSNSVASATAVCRLPIVIVALNQTRHRLIAYRHRGIKLYSFTNQEDF
mmetsp:Transcript_5320/g.5183  ORF Transcript_5320/g.5183 Transcript_5320/m.5183 type:complete len:124 (+) Transcript_5320:678-1049(+)